MKKIFEYFSLSKTERNGFIVMVVIILLSLGVGSVYKKITKVSSPQYSLVELPIANPNASHETNNRKFPSYTEKKLNKPVTYFKFNPNNLPDSLWSTLGLTAKQIAIIKNYERKGGKFYKKEDLAKIYSISSETYNKLLPYIDIPDVHTPKQYPENSGIRKTTLVIDINTADTSKFKELRGIGSSYARRIVNYRNSLGGFYDVEQVKEVYGMSEELFNAIKPHLSLQSLDLIKININKVDFDVLKRHPYVSHKEAQLIVNYRKQHGFYNSVNDLKKIIALNENFFIKIEPYLEF